MKEDVLILAIESSCDETAAAVVKNGREVLSNVISSQIALHTLYGGVVPEIASRKHIEKINQVVQAALDEANVTLDDITAIGVTYGPGLVGALLVGVAEAKAIAYAAKKPLVGVHHIEGHIAANFIEHNLGTALAVHINFEKSGCSLIGIFDSNKKIVGNPLGKLTITDIDDLEKFCRENKPEVAVLCIPKSVTKEIVDRLTELGVRSFWNFSHYDINVEHKNIIVENVHLGDSLLTLSYGVNNNLDNDK